ncbi:1,2-dihydroxy-3-keto-5-methylthiopentene dioxygenase [Azospirillum griseum]|uniref:Acireductone dioxygenase n=1 Tax=Azospirillum griseum TaxID=2496639 RepID=A0A431VJ85_9PROT|nr:acireductone dioxygenase [Azospirillum griseum]RTR21547.1 acireductone dioxygenase [Azospirillum griseum]
MTHLTVYHEDDPGLPELATGDPVVLVGHLAMTGILFERWSATHPVSQDADSAAILSAYAPDVERLCANRGYRSVDVARVVSGSDNIGTLRAMFLDEHTHGEDEARFFVEGSGAFYLHLDQRVFRIVCEAGDLLSIPGGTRHWFDMGPTPHFTAIRFFTHPDGWRAVPTGSGIAARFPGYDGSIDRTR